jgi:hypothetical protein
MKIGIVLGAALALAPAAALANNQGQTNQGQNQPSQNQPAQNQAAQNQAGQNQPAQNQAAQNQNQPSSAQSQDVTTQRLLPKDAKLVGAVESTDIRAFPEQMAKGAQQSANIEKEGVVGVGGIDRVWTTKAAYKRTVSQLDQKLKGEGIEPIAKTTTQSSTAWNVRMPDGHIANLVVRNTQPTTIESVQAAAMMGTMTDQGQNSQQQAAPSSKTKSNPNGANNNP